MKTGNFIKIRVLLVLTSHNLSYVILLESKYKQIFNKIKKNLLFLYA